MAAGMTSMSFKMKEHFQAQTPADKTPAAYALLAYNCWPAAASRSPVGVALWLSFWPQFVLTAALGLVQLAAMYVGPSLIDRFVEFIRQGGTPWDGLRLVLTLLGEAVQTLASHHYNWACASATR
jgi:ATP-binding cassette subfamily C (CFTR/MRP) protein 1